MKLSGGTIEWPKRRVDEGSGDGVSPPQGWGSGGVTPGKILKFETPFGAIWCILPRN